MPLPGGGVGRLHHPAADPPDPNLASAGCGGFPRRVSTVEAGLWTLGAATILGVPLRAWVARGRPYALFTLILLLLSVPAALVAHGRLRWALPPAAVPWLDATFVWGLVAAAAHLLALAEPRLRRTPFRLGISVPAMVFLSTGALSLIWLAVLAPLGVVVALTAGGLTGLPGWLYAVPPVVALTSIITSARPRRETVRFSLVDPDDYATGAPTSPPAATVSQSLNEPSSSPASPAEFELRRLRVTRQRSYSARARHEDAPAAGQRVLHVVQITDPHLGPWQPVRKLAREIERLCAGEPDLVLVTGDLLTMESGGTPGALAEALAPLRRLTGRTFAVLGNHDHESLDEVGAGLHAAGVRLLVDEEILVETQFGPIRILGADWRGRGRAEHLQNLFASWPRGDALPRLLLLHDPSAFRLVPPGAADLTFSGHTHGGQLGLVSLGLDWTVLSRTRWPDHGLFASGPNRLYVHRGTGHYGFPLRIGVPGEASRLEIELPPGAE